MLRPEASRVIIRPFIPDGERRIKSIVKHALDLSEEQVAGGLETIREEFASRHFDLDGVLTLNYHKIKQHVNTEHSLSANRKLLIGAHFSGEYALESAALFNPSIVPHPDQTDALEGGLRFIMSLRATGEGHISSIEFRSGMIEPGGEIHIDPTSRFVAAPEVHPNPSYRKTNFVHKLNEMGFDSSFTAEVMQSLGVQFTRDELEKAIEAVLQSHPGADREQTRTIECIAWLADSNYEVAFSSRTNLSERIIFPVSANESNGIEDARFVRFTEDDGSVLFYATYTAYNGRAVLPQLIETPDFLSFRVVTLNGKQALNKNLPI